MWNGQVYRFADFPQYCTLFDLNSFPTPNPSDFYYFFLRILFLLFHFHLNIYLKICFCISQLKTGPLHLGLFTK